MVPNRNNVAQSEGFGRCSLQNSPLHHNILAYSFAGVTCEYCCINAWFVFYAIHINFVCEKRTRNDNQRRRTSA